MKINLLFFVIFISVGLIFILLAIIFKLKDKSIVKKCNQVVKGSVIKYTLYENNGVHFPVIEYSVNDEKYTQVLKYGWIISKETSFNDVKTKVESDAYGENLKIIKNSHLSTNVLKEKFPIGETLDVFYNPQKPKQSYVLRFVKSPMTKIFLLTGVLFIILSFIGILFI